MYETQKKKKCTRKRSFRQGRGGRVGGFHTSTRLGGYLESLYSTHDVKAFCAAVTVWCREPEQKDSLFNYHVYWQNHSVFFAYEANGKKKIYYIYFFYLLLKILKLTIAFFCRLWFLEANQD
jgi:hypothetical protein